jgi:hypothetical protein
MSILRGHWRVAAGARRRAQTPRESKEILGLSKEKGLDLFGFLWPIQAFSMGYGESKQKIPFPSASDRRTSQILVRRLGNRTIDFDY